MTTDSGARGRQPRPEAALPQTRSVTARAARFAAPQRRNFRSELREVRSTVEFVVETDGPIPVRALGPVLYVGDTVLTECVAEDETHYRFIAHAPVDLREGAPITLGWSGVPGGERVDTGERFVAPDGFTPSS